VTHTLELGILSTYPLNRDFITVSSNSLVLVFEAREAAMRGGYGSDGEGDAEGYVGVGIGFGGGEGERVWLKVVLKGWGSGVTSRGLVGIMREV